MSNVPYNIEDITLELINELKTLKSGMDLSDLGNVIGNVVYKYFTVSNKNVIGFDPVDFLHGIDHGISVADGTHDTEQYRMNRYFNIPREVFKRWCQD